MVRAPPSRLLFRALALLILAWLLSGGLAFHPLSSRGDGQYGAPLTASTQPGLLFVRAQSGATRERDQPHG